MDSETLPAQRDTEPKSDVIVRLTQLAARSVARRRNVIRTLFSAGLHIGLPGWILISIYAPFDGPCPSVLPLAILAFGLSFLVYSRASVMSTIAPRIGRRKVRRLVRSAAQQGDIRAVGPLVLLLRHDNRYIKADLIEALCNLLPCLNQWTEIRYDQMEALAYILRFSSDHNLVCRALEAIDRLQPCSPLILFTVRSLTINLNWQHTRVQELACSALPRLETAARAAEQSAVLLRASAADNSPEEILVRAAAPSQETSPHELLRSAGPEAPSSTRSTLLCEPAENSGVLQLLARCLF